MVNIVDSKDQDQFTTTKYIIKIDYNVKGIVSDFDIIGALFGQTEGLLNDLELRELQKSGRIGRIQVQQNKAEKGISKGQILIPSSLDRVETAILAATIESVDRVGPCSAQMQLVQIQDIREDKRKKIMDRATELLQQWEQNTPLKEEVGESILSKLRTGELVHYGPEELPAGEDVESSQQIIICEGAADVKALMRAGFKNAIATQGTSVPKTIIELSKKKSTIAFVDNDRGGQMILEELLQVADIDYIAQPAIRGEMVEDLTRKEIIKYLKNKVTLQEYLINKDKEIKQNGNDHNHRNDSKRDYGSRTKSSRNDGQHSRTDKRRRSQFPSSKSKFPSKTRKPPTRRDSIPKDNVDPAIIEQIKSILATNEALGLDGDKKELFRVGNTKVYSTIDATESLSVLILDGVVSQRLLDKASERGVKSIFAVNYVKNLDMEKHQNVKLYLFRDYV
ncbi:MAG: DNA primase [Candidatus Lokiarchaeota archaeon]|nr:DNA primase [Candidatus Lokiarchaeota archaeon]